VRNGVIISATTGGGSTTTFAGSAATIANSLTVQSSVSAGNTRASEKLYRKGAFIAQNAACARRYAGRQGLSIAGGYLSHTRGNGINFTPKGAGAADRFGGLPRPSFFYALHTTVERLIKILS
jgi:hypothetical protein